MHLVVGSDHAGFPLKGPVVEALRTWGHEVLDVGSYTPEPVDFPDIAAKLCDTLLSGKAERGIMVCGTGVGASIAINKTPGLRAALCHDAEIIGPKLAFDLLRAFLNARFSISEEFRRRVAKLEQMDSDIGPRP